MILLDSQGNQLPDLPYDQFEGMTSEVVRIRYFNFMIHIMAAVESKWRITYMADKNAAWIEPTGRKRPSKSPYFAFHPAEPYVEPEKQAA